jgi:hypothetical protein
VDSRKEKNVQDANFGINCIYVQLFVVMALATFSFAEPRVGRKLGRSISRCCILYYHCVCALNTVRTPLGNNTISSPFQRLQWYRFCGTLCYTTHCTYIVLYDTLYIHSSPFLTAKKFNSAVDLCSTACLVNQCMWQRRTDKLFWILQFKKYVFTSIKPLQILSENWAIGNGIYVWRCFFVYKINSAKKGEFRGYNGNSRTECFLKYDIANVVKKLVRTIIDKKLL